ncbi:MAG TPA: acetamidase/formamidase family protein [Bacillota bacterium]|nr:acetamidase/formamidase family protein [Bacillota bacterium]
MVRIGKDKCITAFGPRMTPVTEAEPGDTATFETHDCWHGQLESAGQKIECVDFSSLNPATGPLKVLGAEPGGLLCVKVLGIRTAARGAVSIIPGAGVLGGKVLESTTRMLDIADGKVRFGGLTIEASPMIGVIGVATSDGEGEVPTGTPGRHGGNMDTKAIKEGSTVYLPVKQGGAMLAIGDVHAAMGDGEVCVTGCETGAEVDVQLDVIKGAALDWPAVQDEQGLSIIASAESLDRAAYEATDAAVRFISLYCGMSWEDAYMLASLSVDLRISQCVDPLKTVRAAIPLFVLKGHPGFLGL